MYLFIYYSAGMCYDVRHGEHVWVRDWHERVFLPFYHVGSEVIRLYGTYTFQAISLAHWISLESLMAAFEGNNYHFFLH